MMLGFVDAHRRDYGVEPMCKVLLIAPSTVGRHTARAADPAKHHARAQRDAGLKADIRRVFDENFLVYGVCKVWRQLQREGIQVARCTVARLMREMGLRGAIRGKPVKTTIADKALPCPLDRVNRQFRADWPDQLWLSDFTPDQVRGRLHVSTWSGFVYVAFIIDAFAGRIVRWRVSRPATLALSWTPWSRLCTSVGRWGNLDWSIIRTRAANIYPPDTPSGWAWPASTRRSAASAIHTTMRWPKPSTASTRLR